MSYVTRGIRNNNPFNIRFLKSNKWIGIDNGLPQDERGFCRFTSIEYGLRAGVVLLRNYIEKKNLTDVESIIKRFAPPSENATYRYLRYVSDVLAGQNLPASHISFGSPAFLVLCCAICYYESKYVLHDSDVSHIIEMFNIKSLICHEQSIFEKDC